MGLRKIHGNQKVSGIITAKNEMSNKRMIVNALTTLRLIWNTIVINASRFSTLILQAVCICF